MNQVDLMADKYGSLSPYNYSFNNPIGFNDRSGLDPLWGLHTRESAASQGYYDQIRNIGSGNRWDGVGGGYYNDANGNHLRDEGEESVSWDQVREYYGSSLNVTSYTVGNLVSIVRQAGMIVYGYTQFQKALAIDRNSLTTSLNGGWLESTGAGTPWMKFAKQFLDAGLRECRSGNLSEAEITKMEADNNAILAMLNAVGGARNGLTSSSDLNAWCASFVNWCLSLAGIKGTGSPGAGSFIGYGTEICQPVYGAIGVQVNRNGIVTHVGFYAGESNYAPLPISLLGGNQSNMVKYSNMATSSFIYWCMPTGYGSGN